MLNLNKFMMGGFLTNVIVLYFVLAMAVFELYNYTFMRMDYTAVAIFFLVGLVISVFSKNMTVILILAVALTRLLVYGKNLEGFKGKKEKFDGEEEDDAPKQSFVELAYDKTSSLVTSFKGLFFTGLTKIKSIIGGREGGRDKSRTSRS
jgi:hypothetical protein